MSATYYQIDVQSTGVAGEVKYAQAFGDLDVINYIAKKVVKDIEDVEGNLALNLMEVDAIGGQPTREVVVVVANAKVVATVLKGELTSERKAARTVVDADGRQAETPELSEETVEKYEPEFETEGERQSVGNY